MIRIHAIQTGRVKVKQFQVSGARSQLSRLWQLLLTRRWSDWLPVTCWLVEHPEGPFLIDAGEIEKVQEKGYLPGSLVMRSAVRYDVKREDEVDQQLARLGYSVDHIKGIYLTHFHSDHVDGVCHFPEARIFVSREAYDFIQSAQGEGRGYFKKNLPEWFQPEVFDFEDGQEGVFDHSKRLLADGSLVAVPLPGHSIGHTGYIIKTESGPYIVSGDATSDEQTLQAGVANVILNNPDAARSVHQLREYVRACQAVVLCSHDPKAAQKLGGAAVVASAGRSLHPVL